MKYFFPAYFINFQSLDGILKFGYITPQAIASYICEAKIRGATPVTNSVKVNVLRKLVINRFMFK